MKLRLGIAVLGAGLVLALSSFAVLAGDDDKGFATLGNGKDMSGFGIAGGSDKTWSVEDGIIRCTGSPNGYFYTKKSYKNYVLRLDFRYPKNAGNSGYLIHITGDHKVWPKCVEVQGQYGGVCSIFPIGGAKGPSPKADAAARKEALKPNTEWNSVEIAVKDGGITSKLNGATIASAPAGSYDLDGGPIGFQSEGAPIDFRNIRIKELP